jgi:hypothetical protein
MKFRRIPATLVAALLLGRKERGEVSSRVFRRLGAAFAAGLTVVLFSGTTVTAHPGMQHGGNTGHLPPVSRGVDLIGKLDLFGDNEQPGRISDVAAWGNYAYLGVFASPNCEDTDLYVVDITDPTNPTEAGRIPVDDASFAGEGVQVLDMNTSEFQGQVLIHSNETCLPQGNPVLGEDPRLGQGGPGGASLWNVTDPENPELLKAHVGDEDPSDSGLPHNSHSSFGWQQGDKAYMVVMDNGETGTDIDIFDITDPANPVFVRETGTDDWPKQDCNPTGPDDACPSVILEDPMPNGNNPGIHDFMVNKFGDRYLFVGSYWDGGYVLLDFTNLPEKPTFLGDTDFGVEPFAAQMGLPNNFVAEGNAHQAEFSRDGSLFLATDEDFNAFRNLGVIKSGQYQGDTFTAIKGDQTPNVSEAGLEAPTVWQGFGCTMSFAPAEPAYALAERGGCTFTVKVAAAEAAGYEAVIMFNDNISPQTPCPGTVSPAAIGNIPFLSVSRETGLKIMNADFEGNGCGTATPAETVGSIQETVRFAPTFDGWGYLHLYDAQAATGATAAADPVKLQAIDHFAIPESLDRTKAEGFGDLTIHEVAMDPDQDVAYSSYYGGGFRIFQFDRTNGIRETGAFIDEGGNNFWGVEVHQHPDPNVGKIVLASDRDAGLYIFGPAAPDLSPVKITTSDAPRRGRAVTLASNIKNLGSLDASNVVVQFFDNGQQIGQDRVIPAILAGKGKSATIQWRPRSTGMHTIMVKVDPLGDIDESDEGNNTFTRTYRVRI